MFTGAKGPALIRSIPTYLCTGLLTESISSSAVVSVGQIQGDTEGQRVHAPGSSPPPMANRDLVVKQLNLSIFSNFSYHLQSPLETRVPVRLSPSHPHCSHAWSHAFYWLAPLLISLSPYWCFSGIISQINLLALEPFCWVLLPGKSKLRPYAIIIFYNIHQNVKIIAVAVFCKKRA